ncbi:hypothetical protein OB955_03170 [Halobacteria archaeon AArc-m2/3/4]|uniref:Uncharacterized protein n=1 Tax=Natronoglomus mannanivorans TaxID=2979990 RepID=A0AAP2YVL0_9EURY|nr:hypothetical protein [Halobacteria archaeon AArc-xg1-1]MCU4971738.1 hypothetical protein [Halobacteria archaeon AArc-m2/3/4]
MSPPRQLLTAAFVAFVAGAIHVGQRYAAMFAVDIFDLPLSDITIVTFAINLLTLLVEPVGVFVVYYVLVRGLDARRQYAGFALASFLGAGIGGFVALFTVMSTLEFANESVFYTVVGIGEAVVVTGLRITVAGLAGIGAAAVFAERATENGSEPTARVEY